MSDACRFFDRRFLEKSTCLFFSAGDADKKKTKAFFTSEVNKL